MQGVRLCVACGFTTTHPEPAACPACDDGEAGFLLRSLDGILADPRLRGGALAGTLAKALRACAVEADRLATERAQVVSALLLDDEGPADVPIADILDRISVIQAEGVHQ